MRAFSVVDAKVAELEAKVDGLEQLAREVAPAVVELQAERNDVAIPLTTETGKVVVRWELGETLAAILARLDELAARVPSPTPAPASPAITAPPAQE